MTWQLFLYIILLEVASAPILALLFSWIFISYFSAKRTYNQKTVKDVGEALNHIGEALKKVANEKEEKHEDKSDAEGN